MPNHSSASTRNGSQDNTDNRFVRILAEVDGISGKKIEQLRDAGYETVSDLQEADQDELTTVDGIGEAVATRIIAEVDENDNSDDENDSGLGELFG